MRRRAIGCYDDPNKDSIRTLWILSFFRICSWINKNEKENIKQRVNIHLFIYFYSKRHSQIEMHGTCLEKLRKVPRWCLWTKQEKFYRNFTEELKETSPIKKTIYRLNLGPLLLDPMSFNSLFIKTSLSHQTCQSLCKNEIFNHSIGGTIYTHKNDTKDKIME